MGIGVNEFIANFEQGGYRPNLLECQSQVLI